MIFLVFGLKLALNMTFNLNETYFSEKFVICNLVFVLEIAKTWLFSYNSPAQSVYSCFKQNFNISFCQISNLSCYLNKNELSTNCYENHQVKGMTHDICFWYLPTYVTYAKIQARTYIDHVRRLYSNCRTLRGIFTSSSESLNFCHKYLTAIDFSRNFLNFNFYGQLKHNIRSLRYVSRYFVEGRQSLSITFRNIA